MNESRNDMLDLILGYEELDGAEKDRADGILSRNPDLARHLAEIREREKKAARPVPQGDEAVFWNPTPDVSLDPRRRRESLQQVKAAAGVRSSVPSVTRRARWLLPLAAILALAVLLPRWVSEPSLMTDLSVVPDVSGGQTTRSVDLIGGEGGFRSGDAIALGFQLERPAFVVFCLVDAHGEVTFIDPERTGPFPAGRNTYPEPGASGRWILNDVVGEETFLVAIREDGLPDTLELGRSLARLEGQGDREQTVAAARGLLAGAFDEVRLVSFAHLD